MPSDAASRSGATASTSGARSSGENDGQTDAVDIEALRAVRFGTYTHDYTERETILYALSLGFSGAGRITSGRE